MTSTLPTVNIALSKRKLMYSLAISLLFGAAGLWFILRPSDLAGNVFIPDPRWIRVFGYLVLAFFGVLAFFVFKKMRDPAPGLVVTAEGFSDNSSGLVAGQVPWADIADIRELELMGQQMVLVLLHNPAAYLDRQPNVFKRQLMSTNFKSYGSPITISANALECSFQELKTLLAARLAAYRAGARTDGGNHHQHPSG